METKITTEDRERIRREVERRAAKCILIARRELPHGSDRQIEGRALELMDWSDEKIDASLPKAFPLNPRRSTDPV